jgi:hypothetical protein
MNKVSYQAHDNDGIKVKSRNSHGSFIEQFLPDIDFSRICEQVDSAGWGLECNTGPICPSKPTLLTTVSTVRSSEATWHWRSSLQGIDDLTAFLNKRNTIHRTFRISIQEL